MKLENVLIWVPGAMKFLWGPNKCEWSVFALHNLQHEYFKNEEDWAMEADT
jgi:hypothetical protein